MDCKTLAQSIVSETVPALSNTVATGHTCLLNTWNVTNVTKEPKF